MWGFRFPAAVARMGLAPLIIGSKRDNGIVRLDNERDPVFHRTKYGLESVYELPHEPQVS